MNKTYLCLPQRYLSKEMVEVLSAAASSLSKRVFGVETPAICESASENVEFYSMSEPIRGVSMDDATNTVVSELSAVGVDKSAIKVKINYARFNPSFNPKKADLDLVRSPKAKKASTSEFDYERLSETYLASDPIYSFGQVILPDETKAQIEESIAILANEKRLYEDWGLKHIFPTVQCALNFYGAPGTGKTMAADALAKKLGKRILKSSYADIESKYVGEGPKMMKAIFLAAERQDAVLFIDEADSLLSKRLLSVSDGSAQALNSMRSQLLICLDSFKGIVIFSTNLIVNYDDAFLSRLINIRFDAPNSSGRERIWRVHLCENGVRVPLGNDVDLMAIAEKYEFVGREIRNAVKKACVHAVSKGKDMIEMEDLVFACESILSERLKLEESRK